MIAKPNKIQPKELNIGQNIRKYRVIRGHEQQSFAKMLGITVGTLSKYENNSPVPDTMKLATIAAILKISLDQLMKDPQHLLPAL